MPILHPPAKALSLMVGVIDKLLAIHLDGDWGADGADSDDVATL